MNSLNKNEQMEKIKITLLLGLKHYDGEKTFSQILDLAQVPHTAIQRIEAASALQQAGLIRQVSKDLPVTLRAELTPAGKEAAESLTSPRKLTKRELRDQGYQ